MGNVPPRTAGAYVLAVRLPAPVALNIPRLGNPCLPAGTYAYCGSARGPGGLAARIARHLRPDKSRRWHIDHLTASAPVSRIFWEIDGQECALVDRLLAAGASAPTPGFGSSDCRACPAHLLRVTPSILSAALAGVLEYRQRNSGGRDGHVELSGHRKRQATGGARGRNA